VLLKVQRILRRLQHRIGKMSYQMLVSMSEVLDRLACAVSLLRCSSSVGMATSI
jgi:hypothetical protein